MGVMKLCIHKRPTDRTGSQVRAKATLGATSGGGSRPRGEVEEALTGAPIMVNIAVLHQSASKYLVSVSLTLKTNFDLLSKKEERVIVL